MDIIEAIERIRGVLRDMPLDAFKTHWQRQWLVERGVEIIRALAPLAPAERATRTFS
jgi:hypothetical protein